jgi:nucleoside-diphosphate-sugar epimerase
VPHILIVGCGYTGRRVANLLAAERHEVVATSRDTENLAGLPVTALRFNNDNDSDISKLKDAVDSDSRVLLSTPVVDARLAGAIGAAKRIVFLSTTGVYGAQRDVNESSRPAPRTEREFARLRSEECLPPAAMILRPAAIYGPHRGIHSAMRAGKYRLAGDGANYVSRIHVDDLAAHAAAALFAGITGAWPVADEEPCTSREIAEFCSRLLGIPMPPSAATEELSETRQTDRRVDGSAVRRLLGLTLQYPSYRSGIPACAAAEAAERAF